MKTYLKAFVILMVSLAAIGHGGYSSAAQNSNSKNHVQNKPGEAHGKLISLGGKVLNADGTPASGASLFASWQLGAGGTVHREFALSRSGEFGFSLRPSNLAKNQPIELLAAEPNSGVALLRIDLSSTSLQKLSLKLMPSTAITGRVIRSDGSPAAGIDIGIYSEVEGQQSTPSMVSGRPLRMDDINDNDLLTNGNEGNLLSDLLLPAGAAALFHARTGPDGRFVLTGCPQGSNIPLTVGDGYKLASGSSGDVKLSAPKIQDIGIITVVRPGTLTVKVIDSRTHYIAAGTEVSITPEMTVGRADMTTSGTLTADGFKFNGLIPGRYQIRIGNRALHANVRESAVTQVKTNDIRQGNLRVILSAENGGPVSDATVTIIAGAPTRIINSPFGDTIAAAQPKTDRSGSVELTNVPRDVPVVTIRAASGNDMAVWSGSPSSLGDTIRMRLKKGALITVTGRLLDRNNKPLKRAAVESLHWLESDRSTWFQTAHHATCDTQGRFRIVGLERGQPFSLVSDSSAIQQQPQQQAAVLVSADSFESPRFVTAADEDGVQDLGDITVHPMDEPGEIEQTYGAIDPAELVEMERLLPIATPESVAAAQSTLERYRKAIESGDIDAARALTSPLSSGWSADRNEFLRSCSMELPPFLSGSDTHPLLVVPRSVVFAAMMGARGASFDPQAFASIVSAIDKNPDFIVFAQDSKQGPCSVGIMHNENDEWKVLAASGGQASTALAMAISQLAPAVVPGAIPPATGPAPYALMDTSGSAAARKTGERFLKAWASGDYTAMQGITSLTATMYSDDMKAFRENLLKRDDEGICPLTASDAPTLRAVPGLSTWDQNTIRLFGSKAALSPRNINAVSQAQPIKADSGDPSDPHASRLTVLRYQAEGQDYLMLLRGADDSWTVVEPSIKL